MYLSTEGKAVSGCANSKLLVGVVEVGLSWVKSSSVPGLRNLKPLLGEQSMIDYVARKGLKFNKTVKDSS